MRLAQLRSPARRGRAISPAGDAADHLERVLFASVRACVDEPPLAAEPPAALQVSTKGLLLDSRRSGDAGHLLRPAVPRGTSFRPRIRASSGVSRGQPTARKRPGKSP